MQVFKFGGASVKSASAVRNLLNILNIQSSDLVIVISAMDKTTNALEKLLLKYFYKQNFNEELDFIYNFHVKIIQELFDKSSNVYKVFGDEFEKLKNYLNSEPNNNYDLHYDYVVSFGEILSTLIISCFLNENKIKNIWLDARKIVKTDDNFRAATVDFEKTKENLSDNIDFKKSKIYIIQGFIGSTSDNQVTTLGREGSDYTASVVANLLIADELILWKDVAGIYNADPKIFPNALKLEKISYREATELAYFGAKIIHPKTAKPLMEKNIPLNIRSFTNINETGTIVGNFEESIYPKIPVFIFNPNQILLTFYSNDFIDEFFLEKVYSYFKNFKTKINLIQNSALNLSICFDYNQNNFEELLKSLQNEFKLKYNKDLTLLNIRHYNLNQSFDFLNNKNILMEQKSRVNAFYLYSEN